VRTKTRLTFSYLTDADTYYIELPIQECKACCGQVPLEVHASTNYRLVRNAFQDGLNRRVKKALVRYAETQGGQ
jgi:hypothetical protein